jgi:two-component system, OmpR family, response regulator BaeR
VSIATAPELGDLRIDSERRRASVAGAELYLSEAEFRLLAALAAEPGRFFSAEALMAEVFAGVPGLSPHTVERCAQRLARKLELRGVEGELRCEAGGGLRLKASGGEAAPLGAAR